MSVLLRPEAANAFWRLNRLVMEVVTGNASTWRSTA